MSRIATLTLTTAAVVMLTAGTQAAGPQSGTQSTPSPTQQTTQPTQQTAGYYSLTTAYKR